MTDDIDYLNLPDEIADIGKLPTWAHECYDWHMRTGTWRMTDKARRYLNQCREEMEALEAENATRLAEARQQTKDLEAALLARETSTAARDALLEHGADRKTVKAAVEFFKTTCTTRLRDGAVVVVRADGAEVDIDTAAQEFLADGGQPFARRTPAKPGAKSEFLNRLERLSG